MNLIKIMLGKGLESLIPQKGNAANNGSANSVIVPAGGVTQSAPQDLQDMSMGGITIPSRTLPPQPVLIDLPEPEEELDLPARSAEPVASALQNSAQSRSDERIVPQQKKDGHEPQDYIFHIEVEKIRPNPSQPRRDFNDDAIREMANSIREFGILQPIVLSKVEKETPNGIDIEYQLIAGERRLRAAKLLGLRVVPAIIRNVDLEREKLELAVIENLQRENLNAVEMARAFQRLQEEFRMTQREIAAKLGKSRETVANTMRLLDLPEYIQDALQKGNLSESHARLLLAVENPAAQKQLFDDIAEHGLTTRDVKERVKRFGTGGAGHRGRPSLAAMEANLPPEMRVLQDELSSSLGAPVQIQKSASSGKITISFYSQEELENILKKLGQGEV
jgi:ParB family chromosome partitioning protein